MCYLGASKWLFVILSGLYLNSSIALFMLAWPLPVKILLLSGLIYSYVRNIKLYILRSHPRAIIALGYNEQYWYAIDQRQVRFKGKIGKNSYRSNFLLSVNLIQQNIRHNNKSHGKTIRSKTFIIARDAVPEAEYRYLAAGINVTRSL